MRSFFLLLSFVSLSFSKPLLSKRWGEFEVKHSWDEVPTGWVHHGPAPADHSFDMVIGLKQGRFDDLVTALYEISDPAHDRYGQHLSKEEVEALIAPHPDTTDLVNAWIEAHGSNTTTAHRSPGGDFVTLTVTVEQAERMLGATYGIFEHVKSGEQVVRTTSYSLPTILNGHVAMVSPTTYFGTLRSITGDGPISFVRRDQADHTVHGLTTRATPPASCATEMTPTCIRTLYNFASFVPTATNRNSIGVTGYGGMFANRADLQSFFRQFRPDLTGNTFQTILVNGGGDDQNTPGREADLDTQYTLGLAGPTPTKFYSVGGLPPFTPSENTPTNTNEPYLDFLNFILAQSSIPQTITTSYGDDEQTVPLDYATTVCNQLAQLGARGVTAIFSSGDQGVGGGQCLTNDGTNRVRFIPHFPASCPFVTAVGATSGFAPEVSTNFTGGGFSNYFARPSYQNTAVAVYLTRIGNTNAGLFNANGRGYPDVAAQGLLIPVVVGGTVLHARGTSASAPIFASVVALLNDLRISRGEAPLGFLNPLIYAPSIQPPGFNDITSGSNPGCGTNGFTAAPGWDPLSGLGTPDFAKLQALFG